MRYFNLSLALLASVFSCSANAFLENDIADLEGKVVLYAGEFETFSCPASGKYDCSTWPRNLLRMKAKNLCVATDIYSCSYSCKGLIASGTDKVPYIYLFSDTFRDFKKGTVKTYECPDVFW